MPYTINRRADGGVVCEYRGVVSIDENQRAWNEYTGGDPKNFAKIPYLISDHTKTRKARHSAEDMKKLAESLNNEFWRHNPKMVIALVVPKDAFFGLARVLYAYVKHEGQIGLFRKRAEAEAWVGQNLLSNK